jgi:hypothetical protein
MKFRNSEVPLQFGRRAVRAKSVAQWAWLVGQTQNRFDDRADKLSARKAALRRANRGYRRRNGLSLKYA